MASVESELWHIFTYYTLHGNPVDPEHMRAVQFVKLARECQIVSDSLTVPEIEITISRMAQRKRAALRIGDAAAASRATLGKSSAAGAGATGAGSGSFGGGGTGAAGAGGEAVGGANPKLLTFTDFLQLLSDLAPQVHPNTDTESVFQKLLMENVLPLCSRRNPLDVTAYMENPRVSSLLQEEFADAVRQIFLFYAGGADRRRVRQTASETALRADRDREEHRRQGKVATTSRRSLNSVIDRRGTIGYREFLIFCQDYRLNSTALLTSLEVGDIYLSSVPPHQGGDGVGSMSFDMFLEALLRMALTAYADAPESLPLVNKVKALLLFMWKAINQRDTGIKFGGQRAAPDAAVRSRGDNLNIGGSALFSEQFLAMWRKENFPEYLVATTETDVEGRRVLDRIITDENEEAKKPARRRSSLLSVFSQPDHGEFLPEARSSHQKAEPVIDGTLTAHVLRQLFIKRPDVADVIVNKLDAMRDEDQFW